MVHVMSEVKRFKASDLHVACCGDTIVVNAEDFDAQRLRADTAEADYRELSKETIFCLIALPPPSSALRI